MEGKQTAIGRLRTFKGEENMSSMLLDLVGQRCSIMTDDEEYLTGHPGIACRVMAADDEWIKVAYVDEGGKRISRLARIETLESVIIYDESR